KQGGRPVAMVPDAAMRELAVRAAAAVGADFAGIDLLHDADGRTLVLEVNSMPAWSGLQKVTRTNIAAALAADLVQVLAARGKREAPRCRRAPTPSPHPSRPPAATSSRPPSPATCMSLPTAIA